MTSIRRMTLALILACGLSERLNAVTFHVPTDHPTIQACIDAAVSGFDDCLVAPGAYHETIDFHGKDVIVRSSEGPEATIIDATGIGGSVVTCISEETAAAVLEGFTLTGGTGTLFAGEISGGGMLNWNSTPTVVRCHFRGNSAEIGGGMYNHVYANPTVIGCTFTNNTAHSGGGLLNLQANPTLIDCSFVENSAATGGGGAIRNFLHSSPTIAKCDFRRNSAELGGGLYNDWKSHPSLSDCTFEENTAHHGGAIYNSLSSRPKLTRVAFIANTADNDGGGIYYEDVGDTALTDCLFVRNRAFGNGGGLFDARGFVGDQILLRCSFVANTAVSGGGMYVDDYNHVQLTACTFDENAATAGGGMFNGIDVHSTLTDCTFTANHADHGGGIYSLADRLRLTRCRFEANTAVQAGGGLYNPFKWSNDYDKTWIAESVFIGNRADSGGGLFNESGDLRLNDCTFDDNSAIDAGGIYTLGPANEITRCRFNRNSAQNIGGAAYNAVGAWVVSDCTFTGNWAAEMGGGLYHGAYCDPTITRCAFERNWAGAGGAIANDSEVILDVTHCTFRGNHARDAGGAMFNLCDSEIAINGCLFSANTTDGSGGAVTNFAVDFTVDFSTFAANGAAMTGGALYNYYEAEATLSHSILWGNSPDALVNEDPATSLIRFSTMQGGLPGGVIDGGGNIEDDPLFVRIPTPGPDGEWDGVDDDYGDLRLTADSPCINAGDPDFVPSEGQTDLTGHARVLCGRVDMGAYEFGIGDANCDKTVNLTDFASWGSCTTGPLNPKPQTLDHACTAFDFDGDSDIDLADFQGFLAAF